MKTIIAIIMAIIQLIGLYPREGRIIGISYKYDTYLIEDQAGLRWCMGEPEDRSVGDEVAMLMWNNGTPETIYDDVILVVR